MPHHFRTIEQFVQLLEAKIFEWECEEKTHNDHGELDAALRCAARATSFSFVLNIVRTSNIGIVYPPPEPECAYLAPG